MRDERTPKDQGALSAELVLGAIDRAVRQSRRPVSDISAGEIALHLGVSRRSGAWREALRHLRDLERSDDLERRRRKGVTVWGLTSSGRRRLARAAGERWVLPESPQHARWRNARRLAGQEHDRYRAELAGALGDAKRLLDDQAAGSDEWFALATRLEKAAERVAAVRFCLAEWPEPGEDGPDPSDGLRVLHFARFREGSGADA